MTLYFLRHGAAAERDEWHGPDFERPLTSEGRDRMTRQAKALRPLLSDLQLIVTSPLARAKQTAAIVAEGLKMHVRPVDDERLGEDFSAGALAAIVGDHRGVEAMMLVGHEPTMSETVSRVIGGGRLDLKKGALACVDILDPSTTNGTLRWLLPPRVLLR